MYAPGPPLPSGMRPGFCFRVPAGSSLWRGVAEQHAARFRHGAVRGACGRCRHGSPARPAAAAEPPLFINGTASGSATNRLCSVGGRPAQAETTRVSEPQGRMPCSRSRCHPPRCDPRPPARPPRRRAPPSGARPPRVRPVSLEARSAPDLVQQPRSARRGGRGRGRRPSRRGAARHRAARPPTRSQARRGLRGASRPGSRSGGGGGLAA